MEPWEKAWETRPLNPNRVSAIRSYAGDTLLDVGCGNGEYVKKFWNNGNARGVDVQKFATWDSLPEAFSIAKAEELPFADNSFETITCFEVLEHLKDPIAALREFKRVARNNIIATVPNCNIPNVLSDSRLTYYHYIDRSHLQFYTADSLIQLCTQAGLEVIHIQEINECNILPLVSWSLGLPGTLLRPILKHTIRSKLFMSLLVVAKCQE